jgi:3-dehydroquinate synthase
MKRSAVLFALVAGVVIGGKLLLENALGLDLEGLVSGWLEHAGAGSALLIVGLLASDVFLPVPSSLVMVLSGAVFGTVPGAALALVGSVGGEWLGFELVRRYGRSMSDRLVGADETRRLNGFFERHGAMAVILTRPLPIVMEAMSIVAGLSTMRRGTFLVASLVGTTPIVLVYAWAGAMSRDAGSLVPAAVILVAFTAVMWLVYRRQFADSGSQADARAIATPPGSPSSAASPDSRPAAPTP